MAEQQEEYKDWGKYHFFRKPKYNDYSRTSLYITMRDGIHLAVDILLPKEMETKEQLPTLLYQTRYWRAYDVKEEFEEMMPHAEHQGGEVPRFLISYGFAMVMVDSRGTGASFGTRPIEYSQEEILDTKEIVNWIIKQDWSNGKVATFGNSNAGSTAELSAVSNPQGLKITSPRANEFDMYTDISYPGGVVLTGMLSAWGNMIHLMDRDDVSHLGEHAKYVHGVLPVDNDPNKTLLKQAVKMHEKNFNLAEFLESISFKDEQFGPHNYTIEMTSPYYYKTEIETAQIPTFGWGSWIDAATADVQIRRFINIKTPQVNVIGCWNHNGKFNGNPLDKPYLHPNNPSISLDYDQQKLEWIRAFDYYTRNMDENGWNPDRRLIYYTMGENKWKSTSEWPPQNHNYQKMYLAEKGKLSNQPSKYSEAIDKYKVDFNATTGKNSRWHTQLGIPVYYPNREPQDELLLSYTSASFTQSREITGYPIIFLFVQTNANDGFIIAYLELIDPDGFVYLITEGILRFKHRKIISPENSSYKTPYPFHSFKMADELPVNPTETMKLEFHLQPTSILVKKGWKVRISLSGADKDNFEQIPKKVNPEISILRNSEYASHINIPFIDV